MRKISKIFIFFTLLLVTSLTNAFDLSSLWPINSSVIDKVWILKPDEKTKIESKIQELRDKYTTEILLVIISSTNWEDISSLATEIWQKVWVWKADKDNWVVILISIDDRAWNIATWYWVEWVLPDLLTKRIWEKNFILFRDSRYYDWVMWTLWDFDKAFVWDPSIISLTSNEKQDDWVWIIVIFIAIIVSIFAFRPLVDKKKYKKFFIYFIIANLITLPFVYLFIWFASIFVNLIMWIIWSILWITWKLWKWWYTSSGWSRWWGGGWFWGFWGWWFGWGWSSWKW